MQSLSPLDGRYSQLVNNLEAYFSEPALNRFRSLVEIEWIICLCQKKVLKGLPFLSETRIKELRKIAYDFDFKAFQLIERTTGHDVKALEYYIRDRLLESDEPNAKLLLAVHFGCTSEDINNLAYTLAIRGAAEQVLLPSVNQLKSVLKELAQNWADVPLLAMTHGQPATPTTVGKELAVFAQRLENQISNLKFLEYAGKFNGSTGTFSAVTFAVPEVAWDEVARDFVTTFGLEYNSLTTQIDPRDSLSTLFDILNHCGRIMHNLSTDLWLYISRGIFSLEVNTDQVGSSTMPHKVNPIKFENAEGNFEMADALFSLLSNQLIQSRLQRDLSDSTILRNVGVAFGHWLVGVNMLVNGLAELNVNQMVTAEELSQHYEVLTEAIQTQLRVAGIQGEVTIDDPYALLKHFSRGKSITAESLRIFIEQLPLSLADRKKLLELTPSKYIGLAEKLVYDYFGSR
ncbi:MAG: adenylosuccinate lyase [Bifidobacteriaceae bacterium]|nr:adenylosuccinate lyase [Bifidobacteriaceae bacterium]